MACRPCGRRNYLGNTRGTYCTSYAGPSSGPSLYVTMGLGGTLFKIFLSFAIHFFQASLQSLFPPPPEEGDDELRRRREGLYQVGAIAMATTSMSLTSTNCFLPSPSTPSRQVRFRLHWFNALGDCVSFRGFGEYGFGIHWMSELM